MNNRRPKTYYDVLEVDVNADASTIRKAYLKKSLKYHPDKNPDNVEEAKAKFIEIGEANETLSNPAKRRAYDQELRSGNTGSFGRSSSNNNNNNNENENNANDQTYDNYMNAFDATVAGMSEAELAATIGAVSALAGIVGSIVGSRILGGSGGDGQNGSGGTRSTARSSILSNAGSMAGGLVASKIATSSVRALHQDSISRLSYKEDCRRAMERGEPVPDPPKPAFMGKKIGDVLKSTINAATNFATAENTTNQNNSGTDSTNGQREGASEPANKYSNLWKMASAGIKAAQAANQSNKQ